MIKKKKRQILSLKEAKSKGLESWIFPNNDYFYRTTFCHLIRDGKDVLRGRRAVGCFSFKNNDIHYRDYKGDTYRITETEGEKIVYYLGNLTNLNKVKNFRVFDCTGKVKELISKKDVYVEFSLEKESEFGNSKNLDILINRKDKTINKNLKINEFSK